MRKQIIYGLIAVIIISSVIAYGGGGGGMILPLLEEQHKQIFRHKVSNIQSYKFFCGNTNIGFLTGHSFVANYICPYKYPIVEFKTEWDSVQENVSMELYAFRPVDLYRGKKKVALAMMLKTEPELDDIFIVEVKLPAGPRYKSYYSKDLRKWKVFKSFINAGAYGDYNHYLIYFDRDDKYFLFVEQ